MEWAKTKRSNLLVSVVLFASSTCWGAGWQTKDGQIAHAVGIASSDGAPASVEVRCRPKPDVTLTHPALADMPTDETGRLDWYQGALMYDGWGLDLTRPDHFGHLGAWFRCAHRTDCVRPKPDDITWIVKQLRQEWSWFIRIEPPDAEPVDLRVSLVGSATAIDAVCPSLGATDEARLSAERAVWASDPCQIGRGRDGRILAAPSRSAILLVAPIHGGMPRSVLHPNGKAGTAPGTIAPLLVLTRQYKHTSTYKGVRSHPSQGRNRPNESLP